VPVGTYIMTTPEMTLVPVNIFVNFDKKENSDVIMREEGSKTFLIN